jgi:hypothetical protein
LGILFLNKELVRSLYLRNNIEIISDNTPKMILEIALAVTEASINSENVGV